MKLGEDQKELDDYQQIIKGRIFTQSFYDLSREISYILFNSPMNKTGGYKLHSIADLFLQQLKEQIPALTTDEIHKLDKRVDKILWPTNLSIYYSTEVLYSKIRELIVKELGRRKKTNENL